jgi:hypothetical protein
MHLQRSMATVLKGAAILAVAAGVLVPRQVTAESFLYQFAQAFSGTAPASTNGPWIDGLFQTITPGAVRLTVSNLNLTGSENVDYLYLNLNPALNVTKLQFAFAGSGGSFTTPKVDKAEDGYKADGDGLYDIRFDFAQNGGVKSLFGAGDYLVCNISGISNLTASDFVFKSTPAGGAGPFYAAAHVQRIGAGSLSGWIDASSVSPSPVPEPAALGLGALGAGLWLARRRTRVPRLS